MLWPLAPAPTSPSVEHIPSLSNPSALEAEVVNSHKGTRLVIRLSDYCATI
jgi:hypothetical protein